MALIFGAMFFLMLELASCHINDPSNQATSAIILLEKFCNPWTVFSGGISNSAMLNESVNLNDTKSPIVILEQKTGINETPAVSSPSESSENKGDSSNNTLFFAIASAIVGGMVALAATHLNNKFRRYELEYNYNKKMDRNYLSNAQKHLDEVYIPIYRALIEFQNYWLDAKDLNDMGNLKIKINLLKKIKVDLEKDGLTAFLIPDIESDYDRLIKFLCNSLNAKETSFGVILRYNVLGEEGSLYNKISNGVNNKEINQVRLYLIYLKMLRRLPMRFLFFPFMGSLYDFNIELVLDSACPNTEEFEDQLIKSIENLKNKLKKITLGIN